MTQPVDVPTAKAWCAEQYTQGALHCYAELPTAMAHDDHWLNLRAAAVEGFHAAWLPT